MRNILSSIFLIGIVAFNLDISHADVQVKSIKQLKMQGIERQTLDYSCGAAALSILLKDYFGDSYEEKDILADIIFRLSSDEMTDRIKDGFSMLDLKRVAERLGYDAQGIMLPIEATSKLPGPVIILLRRKTLNHFVVLKGVVDGRAFIADPARGHLRVPLYELQQEWQGETLVIGRDNFGLPSKHDLAIPSGHLIAPENETVRALQHTPLN